MIVVDGGTDSLMAGNEADIGTPCEDMISLFAIEKLEIPSVLCCIGLGADRYHGVSDASSLRAIA